MYWVPLLLILSRLAMHSLGDYRLHFPSCISLDWLHHTPGLHWLHTHLHLMFKHYISHTNTALCAKSCFAVANISKRCPCVYLPVVTLSVPDLLPGSWFLFVCCLPWKPACLLTTILPDLLWCVCWCMTLAWWLLYLIKRSCMHSDLNDSHDS